MAHARIPSLSTKERIILELLASGARYGLQLVDESGGQLKRGTVYVTLGRMEEKGYITSRLDAPPPEAGGMPRRVYEPTELGHRVLALWSDASARLIPEFAR